MNLNDKKKTATQQTLKHNFSTLLKIISLFLIKNVSMINLW